eukprot:UN00264
MNKTNNCLLQLGDCLGVGCDGPIWAANIVCENGDIDRMAVKFQRHEFGLKSTEIGGLETFFEDRNTKKQDYFAIPVANVNITVGALYDNIGEFCKVHDPESVKESGRKCGKLYPDMFENKKR